MKLAKIKKKLNAENLKRHIGKTEILAKRDRRLTNMNR